MRNAHEIINFFKGNDKDLISSSHKIVKENSLITREGLNLESLLFGKNLGWLNLFECLYRILKNNKIFLN